MTEEELKQYYKNNKEEIRDIEYLNKGVDLFKIQNLSEKFIREFKDYANWYSVSIYQVLSEDFIREFKDYVNWAEISKYQQLSEDFIKEFKDYVNWRHISTHQKLSENFIREFSYYIEWYNICIYQNLSEEFLEEFKDCIDIGLYREYHIEKPYHQKKEEVIDFCKQHNLYYDNDYFEAYKYFGKNNREVNDFCFIKYYYPNIYYKNWRVNCNSKHLGSFGYKLLGIKNNSKYKKVKVRIEDWGTSVKNRDYIRVKGFMIIEE